MDIRNTSSDGSNRPSTSGDRSDSPSTTSTRSNSPSRSSDQSNGPSTTNTRSNSPSTSSDRLDSPSKPSDRSFSPSTSRARSCSPSTRSDQLYARDTAGKQLSSQIAPATSQVPLITEKERNENLSNNEAILNLLNSKITKCFPQKYTLYCLDKTLIPNCIMKKYEEGRRPDLKDIYFWIKPSLLTESKLEVKASAKRDYYVVRISFQSSPSKSEALTKFLFEEDPDSNNEGQNIKCASMIIIPIGKEGRAACVYCFGSLYSILNKHAIINQWGLKLTASKEICSSSKRIKELVVRTPYHLNPKTKSTKTSSLAAIEVFTPVPGAEVFYTLRLKPDGVRRLVTGSNGFTFRLLERNSEVVIPFNDTPVIETLVNISRELYKIYIKKNIHSEYQNYIANEVDDDHVKKELDDRLVKILTGKREDYDNYFLFDAKIFEWGLGIDLSYSADIPDKSWGTFLDALYKTMSADNATLESFMCITNKNKKRYETEPVCALLQANAIEYGGHFYQYASGKWFQIPEWRFDDIMKAIAPNEIGYKMLSLIDYANEHNEKKTGTNCKNDDKEFRYNIGVVNELIKKKVSGIRGVLIDRILITYPTRGNRDKFEFGDIFITIKSQTELDESNYIIHVKRREMNDFEKHCNQVIRCIEFLSKVVKRKSYFNVSLQGCINSLYATHELNIIENRFTDSKIRTHGKTIKVSNSIKRAKDWQKNVIQAVEENSKGSTEFQKGMLTNAPNFFKKYPILKKFREQCVASINALFDCDKSGKNLSFEDAEFFFETVEHFIKVAEKLFTDQRVKEEVSNRTYIILAIINDRNESKKSDPESNERMNRFTKQQLLSLELVKQSVESSGFQFKWTWIEKNFEIEKKETSSTSKQKRAKNITNVSKVKRGRKT